MILAGVSRKIINPSLSVPHAGWGAQTHVFAQGIESDICSTVLVLLDQDQQQASMIIDIDITMFSTEQTWHIRRAVASATGVPVEAIRLSVTHSHAGPVVWSNYYEEGKVATIQYLQYIQEQTVAAALEAQQQMIPVRIDAGLGTCHIGKNRRQLLDSGRMVVGYHPEGITDPSVGVIRVEERFSGTVLANLIFYSCHPTTLGYSNQLHSADYPGVTKKLVEQTLGGTCLFMLACAGNIGPGPEGFLNNTVAMKRMGTTLGAEVIKVSSMIEEKSFDHTFREVVESGASLAIWDSHKREQDLDIETLQVMMRLPVKLKQTYSEALAAYERLEAELTRIMGTSSTDVQIQELTYKMKRATIALDMTKKNEGKTEYEVEVQFIRMGDIVIIGVPLEPFVEIGITIREHSPFRYTFFTGYTNGWDGYLPNAADYPLGGYEVENYPYAPESAEHLIHEVLKVLHVLKKKCDVTR
jgi:hypothetical protein